MSSERKTVLIINESIHPDTAGGVESYLRDLITELKDCGYDMITLSRAREKNSPSLEVIDGVKVYRYRGPQSGSRLYFLHPLWSIYGSLRMIRRIWRENKVDLISASHAFPATGVLAYKPARMTPFLFTFHAPTSEEFRIKFKRKLIRFASPIADGLERKLMQHASVVITLSQFMANKAIEMFSLPEAKFRVIPGGVNLARFAPPDGDNRLRLRNKYGYGKDDLIFLTVRRLTARMGLFNLLSALEKTLPGAPNLRAVIGGKGELLDALAEHVENSPVLDGKVHLTGYLSDTQLREYYQFCDLFVLPTAELEGFGLVTLEAMASGIPVIATPVGGSVEILEKYDPAFLFQSASDDDIAKGLKLMCERFNNQSSPGESCRKYVEENYDWKAIGRMISGEMDKLIVNS